MATFCIQFHATLDELVESAERWMRDFGVHAIATTFPPFAFARIAAEALRDAARNERMDAIVFTASEPDCGGTGQYELMDRNPGSLELQLGRLGARGLEESSLGTMDATPLWKRIARDLKKGTRAGVIGRHEVTGAAAIYRAHRYTPGARALFEAGTALRQFAQSPVLLSPLA